MNREIIFRFARNLAFERLKKLVQSREDDLHIAMRFRPLGDFIQMPPRWAAAVISQAEETANIVEGAGSGRIEISIEALGHLLAFAAVPSNRGAIREDARSAGPFPPERWTADRDDCFARSREREILNSSSSQNFRQTRCMA